MTSNVVDAITRSRMMKAVRQADTGPEMVVRRLLNQIGIRFRVHNRDLSGSPDIANRSKRWVVFVNGCFWHGHKNCHRLKSGASYRVPATNALFWSAKLRDNRRRDARKIRELRNQGFRVIVVWECELEDIRVLESRLRNRLRTLDLVGPR